MFTLEHPQNHPLSGSHLHSWVIRVLSDKDHYVHGVILQFFNLIMLYRVTRNRFLQSVMHAIHSLVNTPYTFLTPFNLSELTNEILAARLKKSCFAHVMFSFSL